MTTPPSAAANAALRYEIEDFNTAYADCLDDGDINQWPSFFTEDCVYKIIARENWDQGLPLATLFAEGRGGLVDRTVAVTKTTVFRKRYLRHFITNTRIRAVEGNTIKAEANFQVLETTTDEYTKVLSTGRYIDTFLRVGGALKLKERVCLYDSEMVPATIVYPF